LCYKCVTYAW